MSKKLSNSLLAMTVGLTGMMASGHALAQGARVVDNIVVTAQKREESLQDVPISISAFDAEALETRDIDGFADLSQFSPGLVTYPAAANSNGFRVFVRGIGTGDPQHGLDSKAAMYVDGVYLGKIIGLAFDSPDLERAEVLKGPQGSLYGRNAVAGAINLISAKPNPDEYFGKFSVGVGSFGKRKAEGYVNVPINDTSAFRVSAYYDVNDGWVDNKGIGENFAASDKTGYRFSYLNDVSDRLTISAAVDYTETENTPLYYQSMPETEFPGVSSFGFEGVVTPKSGRSDTANTLSETGRGTLDQLGVSIVADYEINDNHNMKINIGYREQDGSRAVQLLPDVNQIEAFDMTTFTAGLNAVVGGFPFGTGGYTDIITGLGAGQSPTGFIPFRNDFYTFMAQEATTMYGSPSSTGPDDHSQYSFEVTFTGSLMDDKVDYTAGLYYFDEDTATNRDLDGGYRLLTDASWLSDAAAALEACDPSIYASLPPADQGLALVAGCTNAFANARQSSAQPLIIETQAMAAYAQLTYHVQDNLRVTGGLRISDEEKDGTQQPLSPGLGDNLNLLGQVIPRNIASTSFDSVDPTIIVEYDATDDLMIYASRTESFRAGGFNETASALPDATLGYGEDFVFQPEEITAYELGFKSEFLEGRARLNGAVYYYELDDEQFNVPKDPILATSRAIVNTASEYQGAEIDFVYLLGENFTFSGNVAYTEVESEATVNPYLCIPAGQTEGIQCSLAPAGSPNVIDLREQPIGAPEWAYTLAVDYQNQLTDRMDMRVHVDVSHKDERIASQDEMLDAHDIVNANVRFDYELSNGKNAFLNFWARNVFDQSYRIDGIGFRPIAYDVYVFGEPRSVGMTMGMNF